MTMSQNMNGPLLMALVLSVSSLVGLPSLLSNAQAAGAPSQQASPFKSQPIPALPTALQDGCRSVLLEFYSKTCGACIRMAPEVEALAQQYAEQLRLIKVDVNHPKNQAYLAQYQVDSTPLYFIFKPNGQPVLEQRYQADPERLKANLAKSLKGQASCPL
jgi:thioredoxin 1